MTTTTPLLQVKERIVGPRGIYNIDNEWYGYRSQFIYTIGLAGMPGFGVGCCPPEYLPADIKPLSSGTYDLMREHPHFGNYIHIPSASIVCFVPAHYIEVQATGGTGAPTYGTKIIISDTQTGNAVLPKAFTDDGGSLLGVFIDKYQCSNGKPDGSGTPNHTSGPGGTPLTGGIAISRPLSWPVSPIAQSGTLYSPFSLCNSTALNSAATTPANNLGGVWALVKSRGADFAPCPIWIRSQIAYLALAHAQALLDGSGNPIGGATSKAAWMDVAPYAPKGNNNNGSDVNKTSLTFARTDLTGHTSGFAGQASRAFTGAALISSVAAVEHTTHNGQLSGIVDVNGNMFDTTPGLTAVGTGAGDFRLFPASAAWTSTSSNSSITGATGVISLIAESSASADDGIWFAASGASNYLVAHAGGTFHPSSAFASATKRAMTETMIPRQLGTSGSQTSTNIFGGDLFYSARVNDVLPLVGGVWVSAATAGVFAVNLSIPSSSTNNNVGARAVRLLSA